MEACEEGRWPQSATLDRASRAPNDVTSYIATNPRPDPPRVSDAMMASCRRRLLGLQYCDGWNDERDGSIKHSARESFNVPFRGQLHGEGPWVESCGLAEGGPPSCSCSAVVLLPLKNRSELAAGSRRCASLSLHASTVVVADVGPFGGDTARGCYGPSLNVCWGARRWCLRREAGRVFGQRQRVASTRAESPPK